LADVSPARTGLGGDLGGANAGIHSRHDAHLPAGRDGVAQPQEAVLGRPLGRTAHHQAAPLALDDG
jgi:hypothetical protein